MRKFTVIAMACYLSAVCLPVFAEGDDLSFDFTADFYSKYVWRGQLLNDDLVFQPSISDYYKEFTANIWGNVDTTDYGGNNGEFTEYDLSLDYSNKFSEEGKIGYSVGVIHYHFPSFSETDTTEIYWGFNFDMPLNPAIKVYHSLGNYNGTYVNFGIGHTFEKIMEWGKDRYCDLQWGASIGWANGTYNKDYWGIDTAMLNDLAFTISLPVSLGNGWSVIPSLNYVILIDGRIRDFDTYSTSSNYFFTGVSISKSF
jgi:hypothetical protein